MGSYQDIKGTRTVNAPLSHGLAFCSVRNEIGLSFLALDEKQQCRLALVSCFFALTLSGQGLLPSKSIQTHLNPNLHSVLLSPGKYASPLYFCGVSRCLRKHLAVHTQSSTGSGNQEKQIGCILTFRLSALLRLSDKAPIQPQ